MGARRICDGGSSVVLDSVALEPQAVWQHSSGGFLDGCSGHHVPAPSSPPFDFGWQYARACKCVGLRPGRPPGQEYACFIQPHDFRGWQLRCALDLREDFLGVCNTEGQMVCYRVWVHAKLSGYFGPSCSIASHLVKLDDLSVSQLCVLWLKLVAG